MVIGYRVVAHAWKSTEVIERLGKVLLPLLDSLKERPQKNRKFVRCYCPDPCVAGARCKPLLRVRDRGSLERQLQTGAS